MYKVGVVIQGALNDAIYKNINILKRSFNTNDIVISTWKSKFQNDGDIGGIKVIRSDTDIFNKFTDLFALFNLDNIIFQCFTTTQGIQHLHSQGCTHVIKVRSDEFYDDMSLFRDAILSDNRIHSCSLFFRNDFPYHIGDHLVGGRIEEMYNLFGKYLEYTHDLMTSPNGHIFKDEVDTLKWPNRIFSNVNSDFCRMFKLTHVDICPEVKLCSQYIELKERRQIYAHEHVELIKKYFKPFDVRNFNRFKFCSNSVYNGIKITEENFDTNGNIIIEGDKCEPHEDWLLCENCAGIALVECLLKSEVRKEEDIVFLDDDFTKYCSLYSPTTVAESTKNMTKIQNFAARKK